MTEILDLSTIVKRVTINITSKKHPKGCLYELRNLADFGPYEHAQIYQMNQEIEELRGLKKPTAAQDRRLKKMLDDSVNLVCRDIEPAVLAALTDEQKQMIVFAWSAHLQAQQPGAAEGNPQSRRTTGASSPGSKRSTAATRKPGSTRRRGS